MFARALLHPWHSPRRLPTLQVPAPFGTSIGGANPAFFEYNADAEFDSWLTVGLTDGSDLNAISSIGIEFDD